MKKTAEIENTEPKPKKITEVTLGTTICGCVITLLMGFYIGANWDGIFANFKPYLGFKKTAGETLNLKPVQDLYTTLAENYDGTIDKDAVIEGAKKGMVEAVGDKYTTYMTADEATDYKKDLEGEIEEGGVGVSLAKREDYIRIIRTLPDNPARKAGVLAGDIVYAIDDVEVWMEDAESISKRLRGAEGTKVKLTVVRDNNKLDFDLTREKINNVSADITYENNIAILSIYRFASDTGSLVKSLAEEAVSKKVKGIVVDLRGNGGGYVEQARKVVSLWVDGEKILTQKSRSYNDVTTVAYHGSAILKDMKTVILINGTTASASEIVVGALKDYNKATIVGETSYGKGVVQTMLDVSGGAILKVTTSHWYTTNVNGINETGIEPDEKVERTYEQINKGEDPQLDKAKSLLQ